MRKGRFFCVLVVFLLMAAGVSTSLGESRKGALVIADPHSCWVPYNIKSADGKWATGLNVTSYFYDEVITARFYAPGTPEIYATVTVPLDDGGMWTGMVQNLLATPSSFVDRSLIIFDSVSGFFSVTQFVVSTNAAYSGFGHQTFYATPEEASVM